MSNIFAERLSSLRKEHRISQKEASAYFGISQALLSHYENGIRQCNIEFVVKAAGFYGVSTDYLLGISEAKTPSEEVYIASHPGDSKLSYATLQRAVGALCRQFEGLSDKPSSGTLSEPCLYLYKMILQGISAGKIPSGWLGIDSASKASELIKIINTLNLNPMISIEGKISLLKSDVTAPECVRTVISEAQKIFADTGSRISEKLSAY